MEKTLLIMAAGLGSRFGGLKQLEPIGPNGEFIIDYSIYDAIRFGFTKIILVIKEENYELFHKTIGSRIEEKIKVEYVFQKNTDVPINSELILNREKPLGTAHVIYSARNAINEPFGLINADDFYGYDAFKSLSEFLDNKCTFDTYGLIAYGARNTLSESGEVKRGVITSVDNYLIKLSESSIRKVENNLRVVNLESEIISIFEDDVFVSMNMFCFHNNIANYSHDEMIRFMDKSNYASDKESYMPDLITNLINEGKIKVSIETTSSKWFGVTYKEDLENVKNSIQILIDEGVYPNNLWD